MLEIAIAVVAALIGFVLGVGYGLGLALRWLRRIRDEIPNRPARLAIDEAIARVERRGKT